jgi:hypothetical protein
MKFTLVAAFIAAAVWQPLYAQSTPDEMARSLGEMEWHASVCRLPTAPLEAARERMIGRIQAGSLDAEHLRQELLAGRAEYERLFGSHMNCATAADEVAGLIAKTDKYGSH